MGFISMWTGYACPVGEGVGVTSREFVVQDLLVMLFYNGVEDWFDVGRLLPHLAVLPLTFPPSTTSISRAHRQCLTHEESK